MSIDDLKRVSIRELYDAERSDGRETSGGSKYTIRCPGHEDRTPSAVVFLDTNTFYCSACGEKGSVIDYVMLRDSCSLPAALDTLKRYTGNHAPTPAQAPKKRDDALEKKRRDTSDFLTFIQQNIPKKDDIKTEADAILAAQRMAAADVVQAELDEIEYQQYIEELRRRNNVRT